MEGWKTESRPRLVPADFSILHLLFSFIFSLGRASWISPSRRGRRSSPCRAVCLFQFVQTFDRRAARAGDLILQRAGMDAGFKTIFSRAEHGLRGELRRHIARQTSSHAAIAQRFDELIHTPGRCRSGPVTASSNDSFTCIATPTAEKVFAQVRHQRRWRLYRTQTLADSPTRAGCSASRG